MGFTQCSTDPCIFAHIEDCGTVLIGVYVDDLLVTGTCVSLVDKFFDEMKVLELKVLGNVANSWA